MTSWQDQQMRGGAGAAVDPATGQPMSRRAAREAERRAAEALAQRQPHPSGVVDFEAHDFSGDFEPDQGFDVGDTQDIWAALTHGQRPETRLPADDFNRFRSGVPEAPAAGRDDTGTVSGELLDRVRDAVLRRNAEQQAPQAAQQPESPVGYREVSGATRRQRRERETSDLREDGLPTELFADQRRPPSAPQPVVPQPVAFQPVMPYPTGGQPIQYGEQPEGFDQYDYDDDGYDDEPYSTDPTVAIPLTPMDVAPPSHTTNPIALPQSFVEPAGDDAMTFSSPIPAVYADPRDEWPAAQSAPAFIAPPEPWGNQQASESASIPAQPVMPFIEPRPAAQSAPIAQFQDPQLGPPSEVTDLAGFEALIRKARQQPPAPQPAQQQAAGPALAWADEDVQEGFTGLLGRSVQGSHGSSSALILPNDPQPDFTQALSANGDIFITGSMNLSRSLSTTGASSELYDSPEIDRLYEASQDEPAAGVAPVRASKAVSGGTHDRRLVGGRRGRGNILPTVLAIVAGVMAVGVVTLLVGSWVLKLF